MSNHYPAIEAQIISSFEQKADDWTTELLRHGVEWQMVPVLYAEARGKLRAAGNSTFAPTLDSLIEQWEQVCRERESLARREHQRTTESRREDHAYAAKAAPSDFEYFLRIGREYLGWKG